MANQTELRPFGICASRALALTATFALGCSAERGEVSSPFPQADAGVAYRADLGADMGSPVAPDAGAMTTTDVGQHHDEDGGHHESDAGHTPVPTDPVGYSDFSQDCQPSHSHPAHPYDPDKQAEHERLLELFVDDQAPGAFVAVADGSWFDRSTWNLGAVPGAGARVLIPCGRTIWYTDESDARLDRVAVQGILHFSYDANTKMVTDTLLGSPGSVFTIGLDVSPVQPQVSAQIILHQDKGAIDGTNDPDRLTRGVILHGTSRITGQDKAEFLRTSGAAAGARELTFTEEPTGWRVGDKLVVSAVHNELRRRTWREMSVYQDEVVLIDAIVDLGGGSYRVDIDRPLQFDHIPPANQRNLTLTVPVANFSRNVFIGTETPAADYTGNGRTVPVPLRGHVMLMHSRDVRIKNAEFYELGRTDKSAFFDDNNVAGRYALHFHRTGASTMNQAAIASGNAVWGSPGWGIVHHDSHLDVLSNAVFGVYGSGIVAEAGNETGAWNDNIVIQTVGRYVTFNAQQQVAGNANEVVYQAQVENNSFIQGEAYGMKSRLLDIKNNIAVSANGAGFSFWPHGSDGPSHIGSSAVSYEAAQGYDPYYGSRSIYPGRVATRTFFGNEVIASRHGLNTSANKVAHRSDLDILIEDLLTWNVDQPIMSFYQQNYIIRESTFIHGTGNADYNYNGVDDGALSSATHIHDPTEFKMVNNYFEGYDVITKEPMRFILGNTAVGTAVTTPSGPTGLYREGYTADNDTIEVLDNSAAWQSNLPNTLGTLRAQVDIAASTLEMTRSNLFFSVFVRKTDSLGTVTQEMGAPRAKAFRFSTPASIWPNVTAKDGYYQNADGKIYMVLHITVSDRVTGSAGQLPVAIELSFLNGDPADLPQGSVNNGPLPAELQGDQVGTLQMVDIRTLGTVGNQL